MRKICASVVLLACIPLFVASAWAQTVTKATVRFQTPKEGNASFGKDGDSQVRDRISCGPKDYWQLFRCSSGNHGGDVWEVGADSTQTMTQVLPLTKVQLAGCVFTAGLKANGNDEWHSSYTLTLTFSDGTQVNGGGGGGGK